MNSIPIATTNGGRARPWMGVLVGGLIAGAFDITYAIVATGMHGRSPVWLLQTVASGLVGAKAFDMGVPGGVLGLICHFSIALIAASVYYFAYRHVALVRRSVWLSGVVFGVCVYLVMNFVILPLSAFPLTMSYPMSALVRGFVSHALLFGLPVAWAVRHFSRGR